MYWLRFNLGVVLNVFFVEVVILLFLVIICYFGIFVVLGVLWGVWWFILLYDLIKVI